MNGVDGLPNGYCFFNANKCKVFHIGNNNPRFDYEMTDKNYNKVNIKVVDHEKDLGVIFQENLKGSLAWYGELTWESAHAWILIILCYLIVWGITLIFMVHLSVYAISLLIYDVMNDITIIP